MENKKPVNLDKSLRDKDGNYRKPTNYYSYMKVGDLKQQLEDIPNDVGVFIRCCYDSTGNIVEAGIADNTEYNSFGKKTRGIIIGPANTDYIIRGKIID